MVIDKAAMFRCVSAAGHDLPNAAADADMLAILEPTVSSGKPRHRARKIAKPLRLEPIKMTLVIALKDAALEHIFGRLVLLIGKPAFV